MQAALQENVLTRPIETQKELGPLDGRNFASAWTGSYLDVFMMTDVGLKREKNEDSCVFCIPKTSSVAEESGMLFAVADGMGGASAGEYASRMALNVLCETYFSEAPENVPKALQNAIEIANERVFEEAEVNPIYSGMGTTVSAAVLHGHYLYIAQVGDSRVYLLREGSGIHQITFDHSLVAEQVRSGLIREDEARNHSLKNLITRAVGIKDNVRVDMYALRIQARDTLLICSDGLSNMVTDEAILRTMENGNLKRGTEHLVNQALEEGGLDNITALSMRVTEEPPRTHLQAGADLVEIAPSSFFKRLRRIFR